MKVREAVVLAAGLGTRLALGQPKFAVSVRGVPLLYFSTLLAVQTGVQRLLIVVASSYLDVAKQLAAPLERLSVRVQVIPNPEPHRENGYSLLLAVPHITTAPILLFMADHLLPRSVASRLLRSSGDLVIAGDRSPRFVDVNEATRIQAVASRVRAIGKHLPSYTHIDMGAFLLGSRFLSFIRQFREAPHLPLSKLVQAAVDAGLDVRVAELCGVPWTDIDTPTDLRSLLSGERQPVLNYVYAELRTLIQRCLAS